jgi:glycine cleavage system H protein
MYPTDLKYTRDHEWLRFDDSKEEAAVGITDFAQAQLGDVVFVELPAVGRVLKQGGEVTAVNPALARTPEQVNQSAHEAWMIRIRPSGGDDEGLLDAAAYESLIK